MGDRMKVMAVFDIGKTNKKVFLWNESYQIVFERQQNFKKDNLTKIQFEKDKRSKALIGILV